MSHGGAIFQLKNCCQIIQYDMILQALQAYLALLCRGFLEPCGHPSTPSPLKADTVAFVSLEEAAALQWDVAARPCLELLPGKMLGSALASSEPRLPPALHIER